MNKDKILYAVTILTTGDEIAHDDAIAMARKLWKLPPIHNTEEAIDENETGVLELSYRSALVPAEVIQNAKELLCERPNLHFIDIRYNWPYDIWPDRVVLWQNGARQDYKCSTEWIGI